MERLAVWFVGPGRVEVRQEPVEKPGAGQALVKSLVSGISSGTEMLIYRRQIPENMALDETIGSLKRKASYPFKYGYANVGVVIEVGEGVSADWIGRQVFAFQPHETYFCAPVENLLILPDTQPAERGIFLPNMETAVNFVHDGTPLLGEVGVVFGLGTVGLLTSAILAKFPLAMLIGVDPLEMRRNAATQMGVPIVVDPAGHDLQSRLKTHGFPERGADLTFELSGSPAALNLAIEITGFSGRVIVGSWYGQKPVNLQLGGDFHRNRIQLISSQVSSLNPVLSGRWSKTRRLIAALAWLDKIQPEKWVTHRYNILDAPAAYAEIDQNPGGSIQVVLTHP